MHQCVDVILVGHFSHRVIAAAYIVMRALARLWNRSLTNKSFFVASDARNGTGQHMRHVDHMRHEVAQRAQAVFLLKTPGEEAIGVSRVAVEKATVIMCQASQFTIGDELAGILHEWCPAIVIANAGQQTSLTRRCDALNSFLRVLADRFPAEKVLTDLGHRAVNLQMHAVGRGHYDGLNGGVGDYITPIGRVAFKTETLLSRLGACLHLVGADDEPGIQATLVKTVWNGAIRAAVRLTHPAHTNHTNTDCACHCETSHIVKKPLDVSCRGRFIAPLYVYLSGLPVVNLQRSIGMQRFESRFRDDLCAQTV